MWKYFHMIPKYISDSHLRKKWPWVYSLNIKNFDTLLMRLVRNLVDI